MPKQPVEIYVTGSFYEMGQQYATQLGSSLLDQLNLEKEYFQPNNPDFREPFQSQVNQLIQIAINSYPPEIVEFFKGSLESDVAKEHNISLNDLVYLDNIFLISIILFKINHPALSNEYCSFLGAVYENKIIGGRNFDFPTINLYCLNANPIILTMDHTNKIQYPNKIMSIGLAGTICNPTILNDQHLFLSINSALGCTDMKTDISRIDIGKMIIQMMQCQSLASLQEWIINSAAFMGFNVQMAGPDNDYLYSIEMSPFNIEHNSNKEIANFKNRTRKPTSQDSLNPHEWDSNENLLGSTNLFRLNGWEKYLGHGVEENPKICSFSTERYQNLIILGREAKNEKQFSKKALEAMQRIMERGLNNHDPKPGATKYVPTTDPIHDGPAATYYTVAFKLQKNKAKVPKISVRFQQQESPNSEGKWTEWKKYKLK